MLPLQEQLVSAVGRHFSQQASADHVHCSACSTVHSLIALMKAHSQWWCISRALCRDEQTVDEDYVIASFVKAVRNQAGQAPGGSELEDNNEGAHEYEHDDVY